MSQKEKIEKIGKTTHETMYDSYRDADFLEILYNIAYSLAIIADRLEKDNAAQV